MGDGRPKLLSGYHKIVTSVPMYVSIMYLHDTTYTIYFLRRLGPTFLEGLIFFVFSNLGLHFLGDLSFLSFCKIS
jgi:hypothetical protein